MYRKPKNQKLNKIQETQEIQEPKTVCITACLF